MLFFTEQKKIIQTKHQKQPQKLVKKKVMIHIDWLMLIDANLLVMRVASARGGYFAMILHGAKSLECGYLLLR